jgi:hypothetical protein
MTTTSATTRDLASRDDADFLGLSPEPPEQLRITATIFRAFRRHRWTVAERRSADWLYFIARGQEQSAVYKLVGPFFDRAGVHYQGYRIA